MSSYHLAGAFNDVSSLGMGLETVDGFIEDIDSMRFLDKDRAYDTLRTPAFQEVTNDVHGYGTLSISRVVPVAQINRENEESQFIPLDTGRQTIFESRDELFLGQDLYHQEHPFEESTPLSPAAAAKIAQSRVMNHAKNKVSSTGKIPQVVPKVPLHAALGMNSLSSGDVLSQSRTTFIPLGMVPRSMDYLRLNGPPVPVAFDTPHERRRIRTKKKLEAIQNEVSLSLNQMRILSQHGEGEVHPDATSAVFTHTLSGGRLPVISAEIPTAQPAPIEIKNDEIINTLDDNERKLSLSDVEKAHENYKNAFQTEPEAPAEVKLATVKVAPTLDWDENEDEDPSLSTRERMISYYLTLVQRHIIPQTSLTKGDNSLTSADIALSRHFPEDDNMIPEQGFVSTKPGVDLKSGTAFVPIKDILKESDPFASLKEEAKGDEVRRGAIKDIPNTAWLLSQLREKHVEVSAKWAKHSLKTVRYLAFKALVEARLRRHAEREVRRMVLREELSQSHELSSEIDQIVESKINSDSEEQEIRRNDMIWLVQSMNAIRRKFGKPLLEFVSEEEAIAKGLDNDSGNDKGDRIYLCIPTDDVSSVAANISSFIEKESCDDICLPTTSTNSKYIRVRVRLTILEKVAKRVAEKFKRKMLKRRSKKDTLIWFQPKPQKPRMKSNSESNEMDLSFRASSFLRINQDDDVDDADDEYENDDDATHGDKDVETMGEDNAIHMASTNLEKTDEVPESGSRNGNEINAMPNISTDDIKDMHEAKEGIGNKRVRDVQSNSYDELKNQEIVSIADHDQSSNDDEVLSSKKGQKKLKIGAKADFITSEVNESGNNELLDASHPLDHIDASNSQSFEEAQLLDKLIGDEIRSEMTKNKLSNVRDATLSMVRFSPSSSSEHSDSSSESDWESALDMDSDDEFDLPLKKLSKILSKASKEEKNESSSNILNALDEEIEVVLRNDSQNKELNITDRKRKLMESRKSWLDKKSKKAPTSAVESPSESGTSGDEDILEDQQQSTRSKSPRSIEELEMIVEDEPIRQSLIVSGRQRLIRLKRLMWSIRLLDTARMFRKFVMSRSWGGLKKNVYELGSGRRFGLRRSLFLNYKSYGLWTSKKSRNVKRARMLGLKHEGNPSIDVWKEAEEMIKRKHHSKNSKDSKEVKDKGKDATNLEAPPSVPKEILRPLVDAHLRTYVKQRELNPDLDARALVLSNLSDGLQQRISYSVLREPVWRFAARVAAQQSSTLGRPGMLDIWCRMKQIQSKNSLIQASRAIFCAPYSSSRLVFFPTGVGLRSLGMGVLTTPPPIDTLLKLIQNGIWEPIDSPAHYSALAAYSYIRNQLLKTAKTEACDLPLLSASQQEKILQPKSRVHGTTRAFRFEFPSTIRQIAPMQPGLETYGHRILAEARRRAALDVWLEPSRWSNADKNLFGTQGAASWAAADPSYDPNLPEYGAELDQNDDLRSDSLATLELGLTSTNAHLLSDDEIDSELRRPQITHYMTRDSERTTAHLSGLRPYRMTSKLKSKDRAERADIEARLLDAEENLSYVSAGLVDFTDSTTGYTGFSTKATNSAMIEAAAVSLETDLRDLPKGEDSALVEMNDNKNRNGGQKCVGEDAVPLGVVPSSVQASTESRNVAVRRGGGVDMDVRFRDLNAQLIDRGSALADKLLFARTHRQAAVFKATLRCIGPDDYINDDAHLANSDDEDILGSDDDGRDGFSDDDDFDAETAFHHPLEEDADICRALGLEEPHPNERFSQLEDEEPMDDQRTYLRAYRRSEWIGARLTLKRKSRASFAMESKWQKQNVKARNVRKKKAKLVSKLSCVAQLEAPVPILHGEPHPIYAEEVALLCVDGRIIIWDVEHSVSQGSKRDAVPAGVSLFKSESLDASELGASVAQIDDAAFGFQTRTGGLVEEIESTFSNAFGLYDARLALSRLYSHIPRTERALYPYPLLSTFANKMTSPGVYREHPYYSLRISNVDNESEVDVWRSLQSAKQHLSLERMHRLARAQFTGFTFDTLGLDPSETIDFHSLLSADIESDIWTSERAAQMVNRFLLGEQYGDASGTNWDTMTVDPWEELEDADRGEYGRGSIARTLSTGSVAVFPKGFQEERNGSILSRNRSTWLGDVFDQPWWQHSQAEEEGRRKWRNKQYIRMPVLPSLSSNVNKPKSLSAQLVEATTEFAIRNTLNNLQMGVTLSEAWKQANEGAERGVNLAAEEVRHQLESAQRRYGHIVSGRAEIEALADTTDHAVDAILESDSNAFERLFAYEEEELGTMADIIAGPHPYGSESFAVALHKCASRVQREQLFAGTVSPNYLEHSYGVAKSSWSGFKNKGSAEVSTNSLPRASLLGFSSSKDMSAVENVLSDSMKVYPSVSDTAYYEALAATWDLASLAGKPSLYNMDKFLAGTGVAGPSAYLNFSELPYSFWRSGDLVRAASLPYGATYSHDTERSVSSSTLGSGVGSVASTVYSNWWNPYNYFMPPLSQTYSMELLQYDVPDLAIMDPRTPISSLRRIGKPLHPSLIDDAAFYPSFYTVGKLMANPTLEVITRNQECRSGLPVMSYPKSLDDMKTPILNSDLYSSIERALALSRTRHQAKSLARDLFRGILPLRIPFTLPSEATVAPNTFLHKVMKVKLTSKPKGIDARLKIRAPPFPTWGTIKYGSHPRTLHVATPTQIYHIDLRVPDGKQIQRIVRDSVTEPPEPVDHLAAVTEESYSISAPKSMSSKELSDFLTPSGILERWSKAPPPRRINDMVTRSGVAGVNAVPLGFTLNSQERIFAMQPDPDNPVLVGVSTNTFVHLMDMRKPGSTMVSWQIPSIRINRSLIRLNAPSTRTQTYLRELHEEFARRDVQKDGKDINAWIRTMRSVGELAPLFHRPKSTRTPEMQKSHAIHDATDRIMPTRSFETGIPHARIPELRHLSFLHCPSLAPTVAPIFVSLMADSNNVMSNINSVSKQKSPCIYVVPPATPGLDWSSQQARGFVDESLAFDRYLPREIEDSIPIKVPLSGALSKNGNIASMLLSARSFLIATSQRMNVTYLFEYTQVSPSDPAYNARYAAAEDNKVKERRASRIASLNREPAVQGKLYASDHLGRDVEVDLESTKKGKKSNDENYVKDVSSKQRIDDSDGPYLPPTATSNIVTATSTIPYLLVESDADTHPPLPLDALRKTKVEATALDTENAVDPEAVAMVKTSHDSRVASQPSLQLYNLEFARPAKAKSQKELENINLREKVKAFSNEVEKGFFNAEFNEKQTASVQDVKEGHSDEVGTKLSMENGFKNEEGGEEDVFELSEKVLPKYISETEHAVWPSQSGNTEDHLAVLKRIFISSSTEEKAGLEPTDFLGILFSEDTSSFVVSTPGSNTRSRLKQLDNEFQRILLDEVYHIGLEYLKEFGSNLNLSSRLKLEKLVENNPLQFFEENNIIDEFGSYDKSRKKELKQLYVTKVLSIVPNDLRLKAKRRSRARATEIISTLPSSTLTAKELSNAGTLTFDRLDSLSIEVVEGRGLLCVRLLHTGELTTQGSTLRKDKRILAPWDFLNMLNSAESSKALDKVLDSSKPTQEHELLDSDSDDDDQIRAQLRFEERLQKEREKLSREELEVWATEYFSKKIGSKKIRRSDLNINSTATIEFTVDILEGSLEKAALRRIVDGNGHFDIMDTFVPVADGDEVGNVEAKTLDSSIEKAHAAEIEVEAEDVVGRGDEAEATSELQDSMEAFDILMLEVAVEMLSKRLDEPDVESHPNLEDARVILKRILVKLNKSPEGLVCKRSESEVFRDILRLANIITRASVDENDYDDIDIVEAAELDLFLTAVPSMLWQFKDEFSKNAEISEVQTLGNAEEDQEAEEVKEQMKDKDAEVEIITNIQENAQIVISDSHGIEDVENDDAWNDNESLSRLKGVRAVTEYEQIAETSEDETPLSDMAASAQLSVQEYKKQRAIPFDKLVWDVERQVYRAPIGFAGFTKVPLNFAFVFKNGLDFFQGRGISRCILVHHDAMTLNRNKRADSTMPRNYKLMDAQRVVERLTLSSILSKLTYLWGENEALRKKQASLSNGDVISSSLEPIPAIRPQEFEFQTRQLFTLPLEASKSRGSISRTLEVFAKHSKAINIFLARPRLMNEVVHFVIANFAEDLEIDLRYKSDLAQELIPHLPSELNAGLHAPIVRPNEADSELSSGKARSPLRTLGQAIVGALTLCSFGSSVASRVPYLRNKDRLDALLLRNFALVEHIVATEEGIAEPDSNEIQKHENYDSYLYQRFRKLVAPNFAEMSIPSVPFASQEAHNPASFAHANFASNSELSRASAFLRKLSQPPIQVGYNWVSLIHGEPGMSKLAPNEIHDMASTVCLCSAAYYAGQKNKVWTRSGHSGHSSTQLSEPITTVLGCIENGFKSDPTTPFTPAAVVSGLDELVFTSSTGLHDMFETGPLAKVFKTVTNYVKDSMQQKYKENVLLNSSMSASASQPQTNDTQSFSQSQLSEGYLDDNDWSNSQNGYSLTQFSNSQNFSQSQLPNSQSLSQRSSQRDKSIQSIKLTDEERTLLDVISYAGVKPVPIPCGLETCLCYSMCLIWGASSFEALPLPRYLSQTERDEILYRRRLRILRKKSRMHINKVAQKLSEHMKNLSRKRTELAKLMEEGIDKNHIYLKNRECDEDGKTVVAGLKYLQDLKVLHQKRFESLYTQSVESTSPRESNEMTIADTIYAPASEEDEGNYVAMTIDSDLELKLGVRTIGFSDSQGTLRVACRRLIHWRVETDFKWEGNSDSDDISDQDFESDSDSEPHDYDSQLRIEDGNMRNVNSSQLRPKNSIDAAKEDLQLRKEALSLWHRNRAARNFKMNSYEPLMLDDMLAELAIDASVNERITVSRVALAVDGERSRKATAIIRRERSRAMSRSQVQKSNFGSVFRTGGYFK